jgi:hypothetical protein
MLSSKLRIATATIVAALALVGAAVPAADAAPNTGRYQNSSEAKRAKQQLCADLKLIMETNQDEAKDQWEAGNAAAATEADASATKAYNDARRQGCGWAARIVGPTSGQTLEAAPALAAIAP